MLLASANLYFLGVEESLIFRPVFIQTWDKQQ